jgi:hypothetical protein
MKVNYFHDTKRGQIILVFDSDAWAPRNLTAKGIRANDQIMSRDATPDEITWIQAEARLHFMRYSVWDVLLQDDKLYNVPDEFMARLREYADKHPLPSVPKESTEE